MVNYKNRAAKVLQKIQELSLGSGMEDNQDPGLNSDIHQQNINKIAGWMKEAGLDTRIDTIGNVRGVMKSKNIKAKTLVLGSHLSKTEGRFNGKLGLISALDITTHLIKQKVELPFHLEVIAFGEFEGLRFHIPFLGSKAVAGKFKTAMLERKDETGVTLEEFLKSQNKDIENIKSEKIAEKDWLGYYEIQVEKGPVLYQQELPVAVVTAIAGRKLIEIIFEGKQGHAGTIPMEYRKDALCAAAQFVLEVEEYAAPSRRNVLATVGKILVKNGGTNKIPGRVSCMLDIRSSDSARLSKAYEALNKICERICHKRGIYFEWKFMHETDPVLCDENLRLTLGKAIRGQKIDLLDIVSGATNDASVISSVAPVAMLLLKCYKGNSLKDEENVELEDISAALKVSDTFIQALAAQTVNKTTL